MTGSGVWKALLALVVMIGVAGCEDTTSTPAPKPAKAAGAVGGPGNIAPKVATPKLVELVWPTPNDIYFRGGGLERFLQPTVSGDVISGMFGSVRSGGRQFHEGLDLFPLERDKKSEPLDPVFAAMAGVVRHISTREGASSYGRYIVLEHPEQSPPVYTLYAHLSRVTPGLRIGQTVAAGETLATMGHSAGGYTIPKDRAHLHFEIGVRMTDRFEEWYRSRGFGSPNEHGLWNGMNLMGLDPLAFFARRRAGGLRSLDEVFAEVPVAVTLRIAEAGEPDFARRYPSLVAPASGMARGWEMDCSATGLPLRLRRLEPAATAGWAAREVRIVKVDAELLRANRGRKLVETVRGQPRPAEDLQTVIEQLWGRGKR